MSNSFISVSGAEPVSNGDVLLYLNQPYDAIEVIDYGAFFQANTGVNATADFISISNSEFIDGDVVQYTCIGGTAVSGLANGSYYYAVSANTSGLKLSSTFSGSAINITNGADENHYLQKKPRSVIGGLSNETRYFAVQANSTGTKLSLTLGGSPISLTPTTYEETHTLRKILK